MAQRPQFEVVQDEPEARADGPSPAEKAGMEMLAIGLAALSKRVLVALADLFTLITVGSAFVLWFSIKDPSPTQLGALGMYAVFVLAANWIVRRK
jgi:hypothetical protein